MTKVSVAPDYDPFLRLPDVIAITGKSMAGIYRGMKAGRFPLAVVLGPNSRAWRASEIKAWQAEIVAARDAGADEGARVCNPHIGKGRHPKQPQQQNAK